MEGGAGGASLQAANEVARGGRHGGSDGLAGLGEQLTGALHLATPPIGITFSAQRPPGVASFDALMSEPAEDWPDWARCGGLCFL